MSPYQAQQRATAAYGQAATTTSPARQVVMLYDGAILRVRQARAAILEGRIEDRFHAVQKATAIVDGLAGCLDHDRGGTIAEGLARLYLYLAMRLQQVNIKGEAAICEEVEARLSELRDAFAAIADGGRPEARAVPAEGVRSSA
jgi:flagellar secretion chaperone FliS